jgi:hypothetical protein
MNEALKKGQIFCPCSKRNPTQSKVYCLVFTSSYCRCQDIVSFHSPSLFYLLVHSRCTVFLFPLDHTQTHTRVGRTPLDEGSAHRRDLYPTRQTLYKRKTCMPPVGFEPAFPASARPQTYFLDRATTGIGKYIVLKLKLISNRASFSYERGHGGISGYTMSARKQYSVSCTVTSYELGFRIFVAQFLGAYVIYLSPKESKRSLQPT